MNRRIETALSGWLRALLFLCGASMLQAANPQDGGAPSPAPGVGEDLKELDANFELDRSWRQRIGMGTPLSFLGGAALGLGTYMVLKRVMPGLPGIVATGAGAAAVASWWLGFSLWDYNETKAYRKARSELMQRNRADEEARSKRRLDLAERAIHLEEKRLEERRTPAAGSSAGRAEDRRPTGSADASSAGATSSQQGINMEGLEATP